VIEQTRFLSSVFLCSEFKLENIYSGVNFLGGKMFAVILNTYCGKLFWGIAGKIAKIRTRKKFMPQGIQVLFIRMFYLFPFLTYNFLLRFMPALLASIRDSTNTPHFDYGLFLL